MLGERRLADTAAFVVRRIAARRKDRALTEKPNRKRTLDDYLTREEFRTRFEAEKTNVQRHYCNLFGFWRSCRFKPCRRAHACKCDANACLKLSVAGVTRERQFEARRQLLEATPRNLGAPERAAREIMAGSFDQPQESFRLANIPPGWTRARRSGGRRDGKPEVRSKRA